MSISGCVVVKNEAILLQDCLASIRHFMDEMIVVDNGSKDDTRAVAERFGCKILSFDSPEYDAAEARNLYIASASQPWIFRIDADCRITPEGGREIRQAVAEASEDVLGMTLPVFDYYGDGKWSSVRMGHLFRNLSNIRYESSLHATVTQAVGALKGKWQPIYAPVHHLDILLPNRTARKRRHYTERLKQELEENPRDARLHYFLGFEYTAIGEYAAAEREYRAALRKSPMHTGRARLYLSQLYLLQGELTAAGHEAADVKGDASIGVEEQAAMVLAEIAIRQGNRHDALHICMQALARNAKSPHIHINVAMLLADTKPAKAIEHLTDAIALNPYLLKPIIYRSGERPNLFHFQSSFLSGTRTVYEHMESCWRQVGEDSIARRWQRAGERVREIVDGDETALLFTMVLPDETFHLR